MNQHKKGGYYYKGALMQRGYGLGGTLRKFFSWLMPIVQEHALPSINTGLKEIGKTALTTAADIAKDVVTGKNLKNVAEEKISAAIDSLKEKAEKGLSGKGIKRRRTKKKIYILKKRKHTKDIFD